MPKFNAEMLSLARESRELTQGELATLTGMPQTAISRIEAGIVEPSEDQIAILAGKLEYPADFFSQQDRIFGFNASVFFHRKRADMPAKTLRRILSVLNLTRIRLGRLLLAASVAPDFELVRMPLEEFGSPENVARQLRALLHIPMGPIANLTKVLEDAGVLIATHQFGSSRSDAVSEWIPGYPPIVLMNTDAAIGGDRYRWTLAHELGHLIMHKFPSETMEEEANRFSSEFLMPAAEIKPYVRNVRLANLATLKQIWKVSMGALLERARQLKTISPTQYRYMRINFGKLHYNTREPAELDIPVEKPTLISGLVAAHVEQLRYSPDDLAAFLRLTPAECRSLYLPDEISRSLRVVSNRTLRVMG